MKKVLTLALGLLMAAGASAQWDPIVNPTVPQNMIRYWTGTGDSKAVICITWNDAVAGNVGLAWGVQWNGTTALMRDLMDTIAAYDSRLSITWNSTHTYINNLTYVDTTLGLNITGVVDDMSGVAWWMYNWKDASDVDKPSGGVMGDNVADGDFVDWLPMDPETYETEAAEIIYPASNPNAAPLPAASTFAASDILYWVGTGANQAVLAVNWADTALAWGYRFDGSKTVADMMDDIAEADNRFSYTMDGAYVGDIVFVVAEGDTLRKQAYSWWESKNNGVSDMGMGQTLADGDFEKWAEPAAGVVVDSTYDENYDYWYYTYVYPMEVHPVSDPAGIAEVNTINVCLYPNPAAVVLNVTFDALENNGEAELFDMTGRRVMVRPVAVGSSSVQMPVSQLAEGVYMLRIAGATARVVVAR